MVEVFKTNICDRIHARLLVDQIHAQFSHYKANFDLEDCDRILRVQSVAGKVQADALMQLVREFGFHAEVLPDLVEGRQSAAWN